MNNDLFQRLLYEEEGPTLDFKREQYRFSRSSDDEKSELVKDILGFANAWRRSDAYILIGVEDVRAGRGNVVGIAGTEQLNDHALQQFINNLTNRPVRFRYEAFGFEGKQVGVICVEEQSRPIYLKRDFGKLKGGQVYVRRGTSTDPTRPATPDEIAEMGHRSPSEVAELSVEFADIKRDDSLGPDISWTAERCEMPPKESIPDWQGTREAQAFSPTLRTNLDYHRERASYEFARRIFRSVRLVIRNVGQVAAKNVRAEITVPFNEGLLVVYPWQLPRRPERVMPFPLIDNMEALHRHPGAITIEKNTQGVRIEIDCGDLQPGRRLWSDVFHVAAGASRTASLTGQVFAENLPRPRDFTLTITTDIRTTRMSISELTALPESLASYD